MTLSDKGQSWKTLLLPVGKTDELINNSLEFFKATTLEGHIPELQQS